MARVFISYRRDDTTPYAVHIYDRLAERYGEPEVFIDIATLRPGVDFGAALLEALESCDVLLAVIGRSWLSVTGEDGARRLDNPKDFVRIEIGKALRSGVWVIPVLTGGARMPQAIELPDDLTGLAAIQAHTVDDRGLRRSVSALIEVIEAGRNSLTAATVAETSPACNPNGGTIRTNPIDGMNYVYIPPGHFTMGCSPGDTDAADSEKPPHEVTISKGFWIAQTPVTVRAWKKFREATGAAHIPHGDDNIPVTSVTWDEACAYAVWARLSLATEAQWEYAARAGTTSPRFHYLDEIAWHKDNSGGRPHPVAKKKPNAWGLYDMLGNVSEWTADWFDERYYARSEAVDPVGPPTGEYRVLRGASCRGDAGGLRASFRAYSLPTTRYDIIGFRCVGE